jgi:hypothetical protein
VNEDAVCYHEVKAPKIVDLEGMLQKKTCFTSRFTYENVAVDGGLLDKL